MLLSVNRVTVVYEPPTRHEPYIFYSYRREDSANRNSFHEMAKGGIDQVYVEILRQNVKEKRNESLRQTDRNVLYRFRSVSVANLITFGPHAC